MSDAPIPPWDSDDLPGEVEEHILVYLGRSRGSYPEANAYRDGIGCGAEWMARWLLAEVCLLCCRPKLDHPPPDLDDGTCPAIKTGWHVRDLGTRAEFYYRKRGIR